MTDVTTDAFFGGRVTVFQPRKGFRAGTDSILLATALPADATGQVLEFGCGAGGALLPAMSRLEAPHFTGLEKNSEMVALARRGLTENAFDVRGSVVKGDVADMDP
ncbi:MAG: methyltransferase, partial [Pseudomonadota bacterium]